MLLRPFLSALPAEILVLLLLASFLASGTTMAQVATDASHRIEAIEQTLDQVYANRFLKPLTLEEFIDDMARLGVEIELDESAEADILRETEIRLEFSSLPLRARLRAALKRSHATFSLRDGRLVVISLDDEDDPAFFLTVVYNCNDIPMHGQTVVSTIENIVDPDSWENTGQGLGTLMPLSNGIRRSLVVSNSYSVQQEVRQLLEALRSRYRVLGNPGGWYGTPSTIAGGSTGSSAAVTVVRATPLSLRGSGRRVSRSVVFQPTARQFVVKP